MPVTGQFKIAVKYDNDITIRWSWFAFFENENCRDNYQSSMMKDLKLQQLNNGGRIAQSIQ